MNYKQADCLDISLLGEVVLLSCFGTETMLLSKYA
jgi:hypothetical protein